MSGLSLVEFKALARLVPRVRTWDATLGDEFEGEVDQRPTLAAVAA